MRYGRDVVEATLYSIGVEVLRVNRDGWGVARCPLHDDKSPSFVVNMEEGGWRCRSGCGSSGDLAVLVEMVTGEPVKDARRHLASASVPSAETLEKILDDEEGEDEPEKAVEPFFYDRARCPAYMVKRGFTPETLKAWRVGWDPDDRSAVIPAYDGGKIVGLIRRRIDAGREPPYKYTDDFPKNRILFGADMVREGAHQVYIVEGPLDAMYMWQAGLPAVATLGGGLSAEQVDLVRRRYWSVVTAFDNPASDKAGRAATVAALSQLSGMEVQVMEYPAGKKDPPECTVEELRGATLVPAALWVPRGYDNLKGAA